MSEFLHPATTREAVAERFVQYARIECGRLPLYERLALGVSQDAALLDLAAAAPAGQPLAPLFFGAVQNELLQRLDDSLARHYPNLVSADEIDLSDPFPQFRRFCLEHADAIRELVATKRVQTNEVARCATILPALSMVEDRAPLAWIEAGTSAGLNLNWPYYFYSYSNGLQRGDFLSPVRLECEVRGTPPPLPRALPQVGMRVGLDLHPLHLDHEAEARWLQSLVWPDQVARSERLRTAIEMTRTHPLDVREGDVFALLPRLVAEADVALHVCVVHSYMMNQMTHDQRLALEACFEDMSHARPITRIFIEWLDGGTYPLLELHEYSHGKRQSGGVLATCHWHGEWMAWE